MHFGFKHFVFLLGLTSIGALKSVVISNEPKFSCLLRVGSDLHDMDASNDHEWESNRWLTLRIYMRQWQKGCE